MKKDTKGFTLIELVVVLVISVILMGVAGSIFLSSTGFFSKITISDQDKLATDKVAEFVVDEVKYSTDLVVSNEKLTKENLDKHGISDIENWHYFYIDKANGRLYHDSVDTPALNESYYTNRKLVVTARKYEFYRLDLKFTFIGNDNEEEYNTMSTIVLPNMELKYASDSDAISTTSFDGKIVDSANPGDGKSGLFIYYKKEGSTKDSNIKDNEKEDGTIEDQIKCLDAANDRGIYDVGARYYAGDYVWGPDGILYMCMKEGVHGKLLTSERIWKRIDAEWSTYSAYNVGDVVRFTDSNGVESYYECKLNIFNGNTTVGPGESEESKRFWKKLSDKPESNEKCYVVENRPDFLNDTRLIIHKLDNVNKESIPEYSNTKAYGAVPAKSQYQPTDFVKYKNDIYICLNATAAGMAPGELDSSGNAHWQKISLGWYANSLYLPDDAVLTFDSKANEIAIVKITVGNKGTVNIKPKAEGNQAGAATATWDFKITN